MIELTRDEYGPHARLLDVVPGRSCTAYDLGLVLHRREESGCVGEHLEWAGDVEDLRRVEGHGHDPGVVHAESMRAA